MPAGRNSSNRVAIVGASSLLGKEIKQVLEDRNFPAEDIALLDETVPEGTLTDAGGEPAFIHSLAEDSFDGARFAFFAAASPNAPKNFELARKSGATVIDLTGGSAGIPGVVSLIPGLFPSSIGTGRKHVAAPSAPGIIAATLTSVLTQHGAESVTFVFFMPASERGMAGVEEIENQTRNLLSFREIGSGLFDTQAAFAVLSQYGPKAKPGIAEIRDAISREVAACLAGNAATPAIQLLHVPVFYGYSFTAYAEFKSPANLEKLNETLASPGIRVAKDDDPPLSNVSVAGESEIHVTPVTRDPGTKTGVWLWGAADNLRLAAVNAVKIAEQLLADVPIN